MSKHESSISYDPAFQPELAFNSNEEEAGLLEFGKEDLAVTSVDAYIPKISDL